MCSTSDCFFFNDTATTEIYTLSLHDALPIYRAEPRFRGQQAPGAGIPGKLGAAAVKSVTIARNYAQALLLAAQAEGEAQVEAYGRLLDAVAGAIQADERIAVVLESPRVAKAAKGRLLEQALRGAAPAPFIRFLQAVVRRGRQGLIGEIAQEYQALLDLELNRVHAGRLLPAGAGGGPPPPDPQRPASAP